MSVETEQILMTARHDLVDCSRPAHAIFWFALGTVTALAVMTAYGRNTAALLHVGSQNPLFDRMERDLGPLSSADALGHDGQLYYLIARDPFGRGETPSAIRSLDNNGPRYRYRRILFPLLAGGFGQFGGRATLYAMVGLLAAAMGLASVSLADLGFMLKVGSGWTLTAILNAGAFASLLFLTPDVLAMAVALAGVALLFRGHTRMAMGAFALAALTKEVFLLVPWALAAWTLHTGRRRSAATIACVPTLPLALWSWWLGISMPPPVADAHNLGVPLQGIVSAVPFWIAHERNRIEIVLAAYALAGFGAAATALMIGRNRALRWVLACWLLLGLCATLQVWGKPNNASRVFAIVWPLGILLLGEARARDGIRTRHEHSVTAS